MAVDVTTPSGLLPLLGNRGGVTAGRVWCAPMIDGNR